MNGLNKCRASKYFSLPLLRWIDLRGGTFYYPAPMNHTYGLQTKRPAGASGTHMEVSEKLQSLK
jgi:hypothetical protein